MTALTLPLNDDDLAAVHRLIEDAYEAGYDAGKQDTLRSMDTRQRLREQVTRRTDSAGTWNPYKMRWDIPGGGGGGTSPLQPPYKITCTFEDS